MDSDDVQRSQRRSLIRFPHVPAWLVQAGLAAGLIALALWWVNPREVGHALLHARWQWLIVAALVYALTRVVQAWQWQIYLTRVGRVPFRALLGTFVISNMANSILPARLGDVAVIQFAANRYGFSRAGMVAAGGVETLLDALVLVLLMLLAIGLLHVGTVSIVLIWVLTGLLSAGFAAAVVASHSLPAQLRLETGTWLPSNIRALLVDTWPKIKDGLETLRDARLLLAVVALTFAGYFIEIVTFWAFGRAFGLALPFAAYIGVTVVVSFIRTFPITFANIGTYEVALVALMTREGVSGGDALAYALATRVLIAAEVTAMGVVAMLLIHVRPSDVFTIRKAQGSPAEHVRPTGRAP